MTLPQKVDLCKDVELCTETTNVWVAVPFHCLCRAKGQATSQTAEMMLIRQYRSQPSVNGVLSSRTPTHADGCSYVHVDAIHISVQDGVGRFTVHAHRLCAVH